MTRTTSAPTLHRTHCVPGADVITIGPGIRVLEGEGVNLSTGTKAYEAAARAREALLFGRVLVIDPSSGSESSMPGYSIWINGHCVEWGTIKLSAGADIWVRLRQIRTALLGEFAGEYDALVIEDVPMMRFGRGGRGSVGRQLPLLYAVAVSMACTDSTHVIEIRPQQWRAYLPQHGALYRKADDADAVMLGWAAIQMARHAVGRAEKKAVRSARAAAKKALAAQRRERKRARKVGGAA